MDERALLDAFVVDNAELERLESLLAQFNILEVLGVVRQELRHSDFLAFLLDPSANHGLGDAFLKQLLKHALVGAAFREITNVSLPLDRQRIILRFEDIHFDHKGCSPNRWCVSKSYVADNRR